jgi:hypothetical protein
MHRWRKMEAGSPWLIGGANNVPFVIPLKKNTEGRWYFDSKTGSAELVARRIGSNELHTIEVCKALKDAQVEYYSGAHGGVKQYAQNFISNEGKQDGLYWPQAPGDAHRSPLGPLVVQASAEGMQIKKDTHRPYHGYYFRMLTSQGAAAKGGAFNYIVNGKMTKGFAFIAYPAEYGNSGIMTFLVNQGGVTYEKDLGKTTKELAEAITEFNPDGSWRPVE